MTNQQNAVLRGGPFDGDLVEANPRSEVARTEHGTMYIYRPTAEADDEYPTMVKFVLDRTEPTASASA